MWYDPTSKTCKKRQTCPQLAGSMVGQTTMTVESHSNARQGQQQGAAEHEHEHKQQQKEREG